MNAAPPARHVGYCESRASDVSVSCWLPLERPAPTRAAYRERINVAKKINTLTFGRVPRIPCLPTSSATLPPADPHLGAATPDDVAARLRGLVAIAHGLADGTHVVAHIAERLAALGFV